MENEDRIERFPPDLSRQRQGLLNRAYSQEGKDEPLEARLSVRIKPTTLARLDEAVDEALHDYLIMMGH
jgi:hypothetical protein